MIHISPTTNTYLTNIIGGYITELRGEVIIKARRGQLARSLAGDNSFYSTPGHFRVRE